MRQDVLHAASCGAHGVVLGMLTPGGTIDTNQLQPFVELCSALGALPLAAGGWVVCWLCSLWQLGYSVPCLPCQAAARRCRWGVRWQLAGLALPAWHARCAAVGLSLAAP